MSVRLPVLFAFLVLMLPSVGWAAETKIAVVDFSKALEQISDGKAAQDRLETMFKGKKLLTNKLKNGNQLQLFKETPNSTPMLKN